MLKQQFNPLTHKKISTQFPQPLLAEENNDVRHADIRPSDIKKTMYVLSREGKQCLCNLSVLTDLPTSKVRLIVDALEAIGIIKRTRIHEEEITHQVEIIDGGDKLPSILAV